MIIIVEGIDRVGKTTLVNKLSEALDIPIIKQTRIGGNKTSAEDIVSVNYGRAAGLVDFWNNKVFNTDIILDRFFWTEAVYNKCDRHIDRSIATAKGLDDVMQIVKEKYLVILVDPTDIKWSSEKHGKDLTNHQHWFNKLFNMSGLNKLRCDFNSLDDTVNEVKKILRLEKERTRYEAK